MIVGCSITANQDQAIDQYANPFRSGDGMGGGVYIDSGSLQLTDSTIQGNSVSGADSDYFSLGGGYALGGGIYLANANATITDVTISGNSALGGSVNAYGDLWGDLNPGVAPGGSALGGGIYLANGTATITDVTISGNSALGGHSGGETVWNALVGPVFAPGGPAMGGGIYLADEAASITAATISGNNVVGGVGGGVWCVYYPGIGVVSQFFGGDGGEADGGGVYLGGSSGSFVFVNDTIANNNAIGGTGGDGFTRFDFLEGSPPPGSILVSSVSNGSGGTSLGGGIAVAAGSTSATIVNNTIVDNSSSGGLGGGNGGLYELPSGGPLIGYGNPGSPALTYGGGVGIQSGPVTMNNTIVALNSDDIDNFGSLSGAYNLIGTGGSGGLIDGIDGNQVGVADPGLGTLADNGGPTQTIALVSGSPAIDAGSNSLAVDSQGNPLATDQRGTGFPRIANGTVDIGAYEVQSYVTGEVSIGWGSQTTALQTASDGLRLLPAGRNADMPWLGINQLTINLTQPATFVAGDVRVTSASGTSYGPVTISGSGTTFIITLAQPINTADRVTITIGNAIIARFTRRLDVLPGDVNDDGVVNAQDAVLIRNQIIGYLGAVPTIFGDINGDGVVDLSDFGLVRKWLGKRLPPIA